MSKRKVNKRAEGAAFDYQREIGMVDSVSDEHVAARRVGFYDGYVKAEQDLGWHPVDEFLPPIDEEVIVLTDEMHGKKLSSACRISYGHRPNPEGWDGKDIFTGKVTHHDVVTYDGWNIPGVKYWMHCPKLPEE